MASTLTEFARMMPSTSSLLSLYASFSTALMLIRNAYKEIVPEKLESFVVSMLRRFFFPAKVPTPCNTLIIDDEWDGLDHNGLIDAAQAYLSTKIGPKNKIIRIGKFGKQQKNLISALVEGEEMTDVFEGIEITWLYGRHEDEDDSKNSSNSQQVSHFELSFEEEYREKVMNEYLPHVLKTYENLQLEQRSLRLYTRNSYGNWRSVELRHPSTFHTLAMDYEQKKAIMDDIDRFLARKEYYKRVGRAWKRGYLLYGPPGTGKSSLIGAMANYLHFDVYDLALGNIYSDSELRSSLLEAPSKSIIVVEDIDCISETHGRSDSDDSSDSSSSRSTSSGFNLSALLNCIDGMWSTCGEERIIVFTTNHKEKLDPALLRPGRMDMHIHMSYCTPQGFRILASNYLGVEENKLFEEIEGLLKSAEVTPAALAEELMKDFDVDAALEGVLNFLKQKMIEKQNKKENEEESESDDDDDDGLV